MNKAVTYHAVDQTSWTIELNNNTTLLDFKGSQWNGGDYITDISCYGNLIGFSFKDNGISAEFGIEAQRNNLVAPQLIGTVYADCAFTGGMFVLSGYIFEAVGMSSEETEDPNSQQAPDNQTTEPSVKYQTEADYLNSVDGVAFQSVAYQAAKSLLSANVDELSLYMVNASEAKKATRGLTNIFDDLEYMILAWSLDGMKAENDIYASYRYLIKGEDSVSYVSMELIKIDGVWKVNSIGIEK